MKVFTAPKLAEEPSVYRELAEILEGDGIVCFPAESAYRLGANAMSETAVNNLMQVKRRSSHAPSLVFVSGGDMMARICPEVPELAAELARRLWPGPLTILVQPGDVFPSKVRRALTKAKGWIGVRVPGHPVARRLVEELGQPLLVSSANLARKSGASSMAQVRKNFSGKVDAMIDAGDLPAGKPSTLVEAAETSYKIHRAGAISAEEIARIAAQWQGRAAT